MGCLGEALKFGIKVGIRVAIGALTGTDIGDLDFDPPDFDTPDVDFSDPSPTDISLGDAGSDSSLTNVSIGDTGSTSSPVVEHNGTINFEGYNPTSVALSSLDVLSPGVSLDTQRQVLGDLINEHESLFSHLKSAIGGSSQEVASAIQQIEESLGPKAFAGAKAIIRFEGSQGN